MVRRLDLASFFSRRWALFFLLIEIIVFSAGGKGFLSLNGIQIVLFYSTSLFLLATAETFVIVTGGIDLSVGYVMGFATIVSAKLVALFTRAGMTPGAALLFGVIFTLVIGTVPGLVSGVLVGRLRVPAFLATFGVGGIAYGVSLLLAGGVAAKDVPSLANEIGNGYLVYYTPGKGISLFAPPTESVGGVVEIIPTMVIVTALFVLFAAYLLSRTRFGRHTYAIGGNMDAAVRAGINTARHLSFIYLLSGLFASLAGIIYMLEYVTGKADAGTGFLLDAIVCVAIGGASLYGGIGTIWGTAIGCFVLSVLETGLRMMGVQTFDKFIAVGLILVFAVLVDQFFPELVHKED